MDPCVPYQIALQFWVKFIHKSQFLWKFVQFWHKVCDFWYQILQKEKGPIDIPYHCQVCQRVLIVNDKMASALHMKYDISLYLCIIVLCASSLIQTPPIYFPYLNLEKVGVCPPWKSTFHVTLLQGYGISHDRGAILSHFQWFLHKNWGLKNKTWVGSHVFFFYGCIPWKYKLQNQNLLQKCYIL